MKTMNEFLFELRQLDIKIWADGDRLRYYAPKGTLSLARHRELAEHEAEILAFLHPTNNGATSKRRPRDELERQLTQIWEQLLGIRPIGVGDNFFDLGGRSLLAVRLFAQIEKITGKTLPVETFLQSPTVEQLAKLLRDEGWSSLWSSLLPIQRNGFKRPFFCVPPAASTTLQFANLARYLGPEQPFYGFEPLGLFGKYEPHTRIEEMAAHYIREMQTIQPEGPYLLGGRCFGAIVALEMAQQLQAEGQKVALLAFFDTWVIIRATMFNSSRKSLHDYIRGLLYYGPSQKAIILFFDFFILRHMRRVKQKIAYMFGNPLSRRIQEVLDAHAIASTHYQARPYSGPIALFRSEEYAARDGKDWPWNWSDLTSVPGDYYVVPGTHATILEEPNVKVLAETLRVCLEQVEAASE